MRERGLRILGAGLLLGLAQACSPAPSRPVSDLDPPVLADESPVWSFEVVADAGARMLAIEAAFPADSEDPETSAGELTLDEGGAAHVRDVEFAVGEGWVAVEPKEGRWILPAAAGPRRVRYRFLLAEAAAANGDVDVARATGAAVEAPPSTWLLRPAKATLATCFRFRVTTAPGETFVSGIPPLAGAGDTYEGRAVEMGRLPYSAFGDLRVHAIEGGRVLAVLLPGEFANEREVLEWVATSARAVAGFYGRMPVPKVAVFLRPRRGGRVGFGTTMGHCGASIAIDVGTSASAADLRQDWILVHEMAHTALPELGGPHRWLEEGLATYVEPLARARAGLLSEEDLWSEWVRGMPNGLPKEGDQGLDFTHTWGRTYWGGALYCLLADLEIRERTGGERNLRDALLGVLAAGGDIYVRWPIERVLAVGDAACGVPVLRELYDRMKGAPVDDDLESTWTRLGVVRRGRSVTFDDDAPLAATRRAMTEVR